MKKKIITTLAVLAVIGICMYFYMYKGHRDIASESADFTVTVAELQQQFAENPTKAGKQYADKCIEVSGSVTSVSPSDSTAGIDGKLNVKFKDAAAKISEKQQLKVKGRFVGYDDLLEEFKMDQASIVE